MKNLANKLGAFKLPILIFALGLVLMLLPSGSQRTREDTQNTLGEALSLTQGVGEAYVLISESGVVVVCDGAQDARVCMEIVRAARSYTGFGADKITILKRATDQ